MGNQDFDERLNRLVAERIRTARRSRKPRLTQSTLAQATNGELSRSTIASIEGGRQSVSIAQLFVIAAALQLEASELLPDMLGLRSSPEGNARLREASINTVSEKARPFIMGIIGGKSSKK